MKKILSTIGVSALTSAAVCGLILLMYPNQTAIAPSNQSANKSNIERPSYVPSTGTAEQNTVNVIQQAEPAVVSVIISKNLPIIERYYETSPFDDFFGGIFGNQFDGFRGLRVPQYRQNGTERQEVGGGTAFFISDDGLLLTNKHVVNDEEAEYTVLLNDGRKLEATVVAQDPGNDIALIKVSADDDPFPYLSLSDADPVLGQTVIAIGNALAEFRNTVSIGVISGLQRTIVAGSFGSRAEQLEQIIQTDAAINQGNSGGPLVSSQGTVIGMNTAVAAGAQNIGFAIPAADLHRAVESYKEHGKILRPFMGIRYMAITKTLQEEQDLPYDYGALVLRGEEPTDLAVIPGSPADKAGLQENDIILEIDGVKLAGNRSLARSIRRLAPGDTITLKVYSESKEKEIEVTLEEQE